MGIILSRGGLTESQQAHCRKTGKDPAEYLKELLKLSINQKVTPKGKPLKTVKILTKEPEKYTWKKKATAKFRSDSASTKTHWKR